MMNQVEHPDGCQCDDCLGEEEVIQQPEQKRKRGRPFKSPPQPTAGYTQPVPTPTHPHARYEYDNGEMRRCHLCAYGSSPDDAMSFNDQPIWFASLEDRARHILEVHTDAAEPMIKLERQRAKEILGIKELWDTKSPAQPVQLGRPIMDNTPYTQKKGGLVGSLIKKRPIGEGNWFSQHKVITLILLAGVAYLLIIFYMMSQGYNF